MSPWLWEMFHFSRANQRCPRISPTTLALTNHSCGNTMRGIVWPRFRILWNWILNPNLESVVWCSLKKWWFLAVVDEKWYSLRWFNLAVTTVLDNFSKIFRKNCERNFVTAKLRHEISPKMMHHCSDDAAWWKSFNEKWWSLVVVDAKTAAD